MSVAQVLDCSRQEGISLAIAGSASSVIRLPNSRSAPRQCRMAMPSDRPHRDPVPGRGLEPVAKPSRFLRPLGRSILAAGGVQLLVVLAVLGPVRALVELPEPTMARDVPSCSSAQSFWSAGSPAGGWLKSRAAAGGLAGDGQDGDDEKGDGAHGFTPVG